MTPTEDVKAACEREYGTEHLPATVRDALYIAAFDQGHDRGAEAIFKCYGAFAGVALVAWDAARISIAINMRTMPGIVQQALAAAIERGDL